MKLALVALAFAALVVLAPAASAVEVSTQDAEFRVACTIGGFVGQVCKQAISDLNAVCVFLVGKWCLY